MKIGGQFRTSITFFFSAMALLACQPSKGASSPSDASQGEAQDASQGDANSRSEAPLKEDAMAAMVALAGHWVIPEGGDAEPAQSWHRHAASGTCMPKGSASWQLSHEQVYGPGDESVSLWNEQLQTLITLYTYPAQGDLEGAFGGVMNEMGSRTCTEGPMMSTDQDGTHIGGCVRRKDGFLLLEQAMLFQRGEWLHKARITIPEPALDAAYSPAMSVVRQSFAACPSSIE
jgi:hypothetical protein